MASFFIDRPVFAWVVAIFILLGGALAIPFLPVAQYPVIAPPSIALAPTSAARPSRFQLYGRQVPVVSPSPLQSVTTSITPTLTTGAAAVPLTSSRSDHTS